MKHIQIIEMYAVLQSDFFQSVVCLILRPGQGGSLTNRPYKLEVINISRKFL